MTWPWKPSRRGWVLFLGRACKIHPAEAAQQFSHLYFKSPSLWQCCWFAIVAENFCVVTHHHSSSMLHLIMLFSKQLGGGCENNLYVCLFVVCLRLFCNQLPPSLPLWAGGAQEIRLWSLWAGWAWAWRCLGLSVCSGEMGEGYSELSCCYMSSSPMKMLSTDNYHIAANRLRRDMM